MRRSVGELLLEQHLLEIDQAFEVEYFFHPSRKWRFDFAYPEMRLAIEVEGGTWTGGRHVRGQGFKNDIEKYNHAALLGWAVLRFTTEEVESGAAKAFVVAYLAQLKGPP